MNRAVIRGVGVSREAPRDLEDRFPGRWNPRREIAREVAPLIDATGRALEAAGWWQPGSGAAVDGGQVVAADSHSFGPASRFAADLRQADVVERATDFLFALPSSAAAINGVVFGLESYQATMTSLGTSGFRAAAHALDAIATGRLTRVIVCVASVVDEDVASLLVAHELVPATAGPLTLAVAWALEAGHADDMSACRIEACSVEEGPAGVDPIDTANLMPGIPGPYRTLAAPSMLAACLFVSQAAPGAVGTLVHRDASAGESAWMTLRNGESATGAIA